MALLKRVFVAAAIVHEATALLRQKNSCSGDKDDSTTVAAASASNKCSVSRVWGPKAGEETPNWHSCTEVDQNKPAFNQECETGKNKNNDNNEADQAKCTASSCC